MWICLSNIFVLFVSVSVTDCCDRYISLIFNVFCLSILTVYSSCLLNLGNCLHQFINKVVLSVMCNVIYYLGKVIIIQLIALTNIE